MNEQERKQTGQREWRSGGAESDRRSDSRRPSERGGAAANVADLGSDDVLSDANDPLQRAYGRRKVAGDRR